jgi:ribose transport system permease protein
MLDTRRHSAGLAILAAFRAWLFLGILLATFEIWARVAYNAMFVFNPLNVKSIALFTGIPILLALGQTFVIISGRIDRFIGLLRNHEYFLLTSSKIGLPRSEP